MEQQLKHLLKSVSRASFTVRDLYHGSPPNEKLHMFSEVVKSPLTPRINEPQSNKNCRQDACIPALVQSRSLETATNICLKYYEIQYCLEFLLFEIFEF